MKAFVAVLYGVAGLLWLLNPQWMTRSTEGVPGNALLYGSLYLGIAAVMAVKGGF